MPARALRAVEVVRAAYDLSGNEAEWLTSVTEALRPMIDALGMGCVGYQLSTQPTSFDSGIEVGCEGIVEQFTRIDPAHPTAQSIVQMMLEPRTALMASDLWAEHAHTEAYRRFALLDAPGVDILMLRIRHIDPNGITVIASPNPEGTKPAPREEARLAMLSSHIAAGLRLRRRWADRENHPLSLGQEGVLFDEKQEIQETRGVAVDAARSLTEAVRQVSRARDGQLSDAESLAVWRGLLAGRYSVVHTTDTDGKRFIVVRANPAYVSDPRGLSEQQARVAATAALGYANKQIAYDLGISEATVATHLGRALAKLGLANRIELARTIGPLADLLARPDLRDD